MFVHDLIKFIRFDQLELHLYNPQLKLLDYLKSKTIIPQAYSPLGSTNSPLFTDEVATETADKYGLKTSDVLLGYLRKAPSIHSHVCHEWHVSHSRKGHCRASQVGHPGPHRS